MNEVQIAESAKEKLETRQKWQQEEWEWQCKYAENQVTNEINDLCDALPYVSRIVADIRECGCVPSLRHLEEKVWDRRITREAFRKLVRHLGQAVVRSKDEARRSVDSRIEWDEIVAWHRAKRTAETNQQPTSGR